MEGSIRVAIADDHMVVINGLRVMLERHGITVSGYYTTGAELLAGLVEGPADILLLDLKMPGLASEELAEAIRARYPALKIIVLTYLDNVYHIRAMMRLGAYGYLLKSCGEDTLVTAIRTVYAGEQFFENSVREILVQHALHGKRNMNGNVVLTKREKDVLQLLVSNFNSQQIADQLYLSKRTVETHRSNLLTKLKVKNAAALVKKAIEMNLLD